MENLVFVHAVDGFEQAADDEGGALLGEDGAAEHEIVELPVAAQLHDGVEVLLIAEEPVGLDDVRVGEEGLDFELADELHQQVLADYLFLGHDLQCHDHASVEFLREVDIAELALAEPADHFEVVLGEFRFLL